MRNSVRLIAEGGCGIQKQLVNSVVLPFFFFGQHESVGRSLNFRVSAYG